MRRFILALLLALGSLIAVPSVASANSIDHIDIDVVINSDGSADVTDHRTFEATEGTEHFLAFDNLGSSEITNFKVSEQGTPLTDIGSWTTDRTIEEKAGTYGILHSGSQIELCFGIGQLGHRDFTIEYTITDFVRNLNDDHQAIYWQFLNPDMDPIDSATITVTAPGTTFDLENTLLWGFGSEGETEITPDGLEMTVRDTSSSNYTVMLAIFEPGLLTGSGTYDHTAQSLEELGKEGSDWEGEYSWDSTERPVGWSGGSSSSSSPFDSFSPFGFFVGSSLLTSIIPFAIFIFIIRRIIKGAGSRGGTITRLSGFEPSRDVPYFRQIPGNFYDLAGLVQRSGISDWMTAQFLVWIKADTMRPMTYEEGLIFKRDAQGLALNPRAEIGRMTSLEAQLWKQVTVAARSNGLLEQDEASRYYRGNPSSYTRWGDAVREHSAAYLISQGFITTSETSILKRTKYHLTDKGQQMVDQIEGFKKFLLDFSLLPEREASNVHLWEDYMVWAGFLGIADKVEDQFNIVDPGWAGQSAFTAGSISAAVGVSDRASAGYTSGTSSSSGSGGGGGSMSSGGGGGGASGGGSGGGTR